MTTALALATLLMSPPAQACDGDCGATVHIEAHRHHHHRKAPKPVKAPTANEHNPLEIHVRGAAQYLPGTMAANVGVEGVARRDAYLEGDVRAANNGTWRGRASAGLDIFGGGKFDVKIGAFIGVRGCFNPEVMGEVYATHPTFGGQLTVGGNYDRIYGRYRLSVGMGAEADTARLLTESEITLGFRVIEELRVYGQYVAINPGPWDNLGGVGAGVEYVF